MTDKIDSVEGKPSIIVWESAAGVVFHITPINIATLSAIQLKSAALHPYTDPKPYEVKENPETSFDPNQVIPATLNPEYIALCKEVDSERDKWSDRAIFDYAVTTPKYVNREDLIAAFRPQLAKLRKIAELPEDDYEATMFHIVLSGQERINGRWVTDYNRVVGMAIQTFALTASEVAAGIRFFRLKV